ncbi:hypothetical protein LCGC14_0420160 [marine sediment metagenome]|uniref:HNH domain-containing protein n=1 Tax=marine sediment metagenome TaxID=412755 RepID=A0A0F9T8X0_9ZZZZ
MEDKKEYKKQYMKRWLEAHPNYFKQWEKAHPNYFREYQIQAKIKALRHYGKGKCACVTCGESRLACLSIDHIIALGAKRQRKTGIYRWLIKNKYPEGYQTLCMNCQFIKSAFNNETRGVNKKRFPHLSRFNRINEGLC